MAKTEVILTHNIVGLGGESDQVKVAAGYARNFLYPQGLAIPLTGANKRRLEVLKQRRAERDADQLKTQFDVSLDKRKVHLEHPIRVLGEHDVELRLHADVVTKLKVRVESSTPLPAPEPAPAAAPKKEEQKTEKRGRRTEGGEKAGKAEGDKPHGDRGHRPHRSERPARGGERPPRSDKAPK